MFKLRGRRQVQLIRAAAQDALENGSIPNKVFAPLVSPSMLSRRIRVDLLNGSNDKNQERQQQNPLEAPDLAKFANDLRLDHDVNSLPSTKWFSPTACPAAAAGAVAAADGTAGVDEGGGANTIFSSIETFPALPLFAFAEVDATCREVVDPRFKARFPRFSEVAWSIKLFHRFFAEIDNNDGTISPATREMIDSTTRASKRALKRSLKRRRERELKGTHVAAVVIQDGDKKVNEQQQQKQEKQQCDNDDDDDFNKDTNDDADALLSFRDDALLLDGEGSCLPVMQDPDRAWMPFVEPVPTAVHSLREIVMRLNLKTGIMKQRYDSWLKRRRRRVKTILKQEEEQMKEEEENAVKKKIALRSRQQKVFDKISASIDATSGKASSSAGGSGRSREYFVATPGIRFRFAHTLTPLPRQQQQTATSGAAEKAAEGETDVTTSSTTFVRHVCGSACAAVVPVRPSSARTRHHHLMFDDHQRFQSRALPPPATSPELWVIMHGLAVPLASCMQHFFVNCDMNLHPFIIKKHRENFVGRLQRLLDETNVAREKDGAEFKRFRMFPPYSGGVAWPLKWGRRRGTKNKSHLHDGPPTPEARRQWADDRDASSEIAVFWWWFVWVNRNSAAALLLSDDHVLNRGRDYRQSAESAAPLAQCREAVVDSAGPAAAAAGDVKVGGNGGVAEDAASRRDGTGSVAGAHLPRCSAEADDHRYVLYLLERKLVFEHGATEDALLPLVREFRLFQERSSSKRRRRWRRRFRQCFAQELYRWRYWKLLSGYFPSTGLKLACLSSFKAAAAAAAATATTSSSSPPAATVEISVLGSGVHPSVFGTVKVPQQPKPHLLDPPPLQVSSRTIFYSLLDSFFCPPSPSTTSSSAVEQQQLQLQQKQELELSDEDLTAIVENASFHIGFYMRSCPAVDTHNFWTRFFVPGQTAINSWYRLPPTARLMAENRVPSLRRGEIRDDASYQYVLHRLQSAADGAMSEASAKVDAAIAHERMRQWMRRNSDISSKLNRTAADLSKRQKEALRKQIGALDPFHQMVQIFRRDWETMHPVQQARFYPHDRIRSVFPGFRGFAAKDVDRVKRDHFFVEDSESMLFGDGQSRGSSFHDDDEADDEEDYDGDEQQQQQQHDVVSRRRFTPLKAQLRRSDAFRFGDANDKDG